jgi:hypothetical protein
MEQDPDSTKYKRDLKQIKTENQQAIAGWDTKEEHARKSSTKPTRSFDIISIHAAVITMENFLVRIQFLAADAKY